MCALRPEREGLHIPPTMPLYLELGFRHIADWRAYDHLLFIATLTAAFGPRDWKRILWLVTGFTIGHSVTLVLATLDLVRVSARVVEPAIAITIVITALLAIGDQLRPGAAPVRALWWRRYALAAGFGLIHGLGFSSYLRSLLGAEEQIALPLFSFNVGLEGGQLVVVAIVFATGLVLERVAGVSRRLWVLTLSGVAVVVGLAIATSRLFGPPA
jgi:hypothetical protein